MKRNWYYRMMLSYTPIFFVVISSVIIVFFTTLNQQSENRYIETNRSIVTQMMKNTEVSLKLIELNSVSALLTDPYINDYFSSRGKEVYDYFVIQKKLIDLKSSFPFVSSIYLYDEPTHMILSDSNTYTFASFADRDFLERSLLEREQAKWTEPRDYTLSTIDRNGQKVVSLMKTYTYPTQQTGIMVINIYVNSIMEYLHQLSQQEETQIRILDAEGNDFQGTSSDQDTASHVRTVSEYTGWAYSAVSVNAGSYTLISMLSNIWILIVLIVIVLALLWFTIITHVHYRPIHQIVEKINSSIGARKSASNGMKSRLNEFNVIESTIDALLQKTMDYHSLQEAEAVHRKRILIQELLAGQRVMSDTEWRKEAAVLGMPVDYECVCAISIEIDHYHDFAENYKPGDQHLLKYILESAIKESAVERDIALYCVWTDQHQIAVVLFLKQANIPYEDTIRAMCDDYRKWIHQHVEFTVTVGIGKTRDGMIHMASSYRAAQSNVLLKAVFGTNCVIDHEMSKQKSDIGSYALLDVMPAMIHLFKKGDHAWRGKFTGMINELYDKRLGRLQLSDLISSLTQMLEKEMLSISPDMWRMHFQSRFETLSNQTETLAEWGQDGLALLEELAEHLVLQREENSTKSIAMRMKSYIDNHYADPDLSLVGVSDTFDMPAASASILFKKETGEKFVDYVLKVRLEHARKMLVDSDDAIGIIAEKVGYSHVLSFHRAFKKIYGFPPGEFRVIYRAQRNV
ncbi:helix-turn-helix domain-containing protein [Paenibacillus soyae]|uniref:Helix-turn-helix domain-containing protein n=1 Tax=Paenibacillus soyae TaxID=2969249 RepID=A0A9X2MTP1_9BACL|nr:helix-turn-helix domain-containing protein [Paenibacillus soyae]MCR2806290.1 helix-turn-helix domain-containing protein [Paenibacillus soyae]